MRVRAEGDRLKDRCGTYVRGAKRGENVVVRGRLSRIKDERPVR
jgi:hypothetical protein